jgi:hypothetical protein
MSLENPMQNPEDDVTAALAQEDIEKTAAEQAKLYKVNEEGDVLPPEGMEDSEESEAGQ